MKRGDNRVPKFKSPKEKYITRTEQKQACTKKKVGSGALQE